MGQRRRKVSHTRELGFVICLALTLLLAVLGVVGPGGYLEMRKARLELEALRAGVEAQEQRNRELVRSVESLQTDPEAMERQAREQGYARPGELVQDVPQARPPARGSSAPK